MFAENSVDKGVVNFEISDGVLKMSSSGTKGWIKEDVEMDPFPEVLKFRLFASFFLDCLALGMFECFVEKQKFVFIGESLLL